MLIVVPIVVRLAKTDREEVADVGKLIINPGAATAVPLNSIANLSVGEGSSEIRRIDGNRVALVEANVGGGSLGAAVEAVQTTLEQGIEWPTYVRLRPFFMTTTTTVLGLLPMALGMSDGAEIRTPMEVAVISGLLTSTFLTLLIIHGRGLP